MTNRVSACLLVAAVLLGGCLPNGKRDAPRLFDLQPPAPAAVADTRPEQLVIAEPRAGQMLETARIAVRPTANELRYYAGASWRDRAPTLLHDAILEAFEDARAFHAIGRAGGGLGGELQLIIELRQFESVYVDGRPQAVIELQVTLLDGGSGRALGATRIRQAETASGTAIDEVVPAFEAATARALQELVGWTHRIAGEAAD